MNKELNVNPIVESNSDSSLITQRDVNTIANEILSQQTQYEQSAVQSFITIGKLLNEAKSQLDNGKWLPWLRSNVKMQERTAQRHMQLAKDYPNPSPVTDLGLTKALILLAIPFDEREEFITTPHQVGKKLITVADMTKRELEKVVREYKKALDAGSDVITDLPLNAGMDFTACLSSLQKGINNLLAHLSEVKTNESVYGEYSAKLRDLCNGTIKNLEK